MPIKIIRPLLASCILTGTLATQAATPPAEPEETASWTPLQLSLATPIQLAPRKWDVNGLRLNAIYSENHDVGFLDAGLINRTIGNEAGLQLGCIMNRVDGSVSGLQIAGIMNSVGDNSMVEGVQIACINSAGDASGLQAGILNHAKTKQGLQVGLINMTDDLKGLQIGLLNWNRNGILPFLPILNFGF